MSDHFFLFYTVNYVVLGRNGVAIHQHVMTKSGRIFLFLQYQKVTTLKGLLQYSNTPIPRERLQNGLMGSFSHPF